ncbi:MAG: ABC transporter ATP-binding protein, partial [Actinomycetes bacterium]
MAAPGSHSESFLTADDLVDTVVRMDRVAVRRGAATLLREVDWTVELDERWVVLGPNGAG